MALLSQPESAPQRGRLPKLPPRAGLRRGGRQAEVLSAATTSAGTVGGKLVTAAQTQGSSRLPAIDSRGTPREEDSRGGRAWQVSTTTSHRLGLGRKCRGVARFGEGLRTAVEHEGRPAEHTAPSTQPTPSPLELLQSRSYLVLLAFGAIIGVPVAAAAYFFLEGFTRLQHYVFGTLPGILGFDSHPAWCPIPLLALSGLVVALTIRYLPETAGHKPAEGFKASGPVKPIELPGIIIASFATLSLGVVLGPEAPLIAIGSGLGVLAVHLLKRDAPAMASAVIGAAGSFAAVSTLLGSPLAGAFLLMEASGIGGPMMGVILIPGMLAAGVGTLIFVGLDNWTGYGTFSLAVPDIPPFTTPTLAEFLWAVGIGLAAAVIGIAIKRPALLLQPIVERQILVLTPVAGLGIGAAAVVFGQLTTHASTEVLFSGQDALP